MARLLVLTGLGSFKLLIVASVRDRDHALRRSGWMKAYEDGGESPNHAQAFVFLKLTVSGDNRTVFHQRRRDEQPVERITVMGR